MDTRKIQSLVGLGCNLQNTQKFVMRQYETFYLSSEVPHGVFNHFASIRHLDEYALRVCLPASDFTKFHLWTDVLIDRKTWKTETATLKTWTQTKYDNKIK